MKVRVENIAYKSTQAGLFGFHVTAKDSGIRYNYMLFEQQDSKFDLSSIKSGDFINVDRVNDEYEVYMILNDELFKFNWFEEGF